MTLKDLRDDIDRIDAKHPRAPRGADGEGPPHQEAFKANGSTDKGEGGPSSTRCGAHRAASCGTRSSRPIWKRIMAESVALQAERPQDRGFPGRARRLQRDGRSRPGTPRPRPCPAVEFSDVFDGRGRGPLRLRHRARGEHPGRPRGAGQLHPHLDETSGSSPPSDLPVSTASSPPPRGRPPRDPHGLLPPPGPGPVPPLHRAQQARRPKPTTTLRGRPGCSPRTAPQGSGRHSQPLRRRALRPRDHQGGHPGRAEQPDALLRPRQGRLHGQTWRDKCSAVFGADGQGRGPSSTVLEIFAKAEGSTSRASSPCRTSPATTPSSSTSRARSRTSA